MRLQNALGIGNTVLNVDGQLVPSWHRTEACKTHVLANKIGDLYRKSAAELAAKTHGREAGSENPGRDAKIPNPTLKFPRRCP